MSGYHKLGIHKHSVCSPYKIQEEFLEYIDARATGNKVMAIQELSDLYGCLENEINKFGMLMDDLKVMSDLTRQVFNAGTRESEDFLTYLKRECESILSYGLGFIQVGCGDINYNFYHKDVQQFDSANSPHSHQKDFVSEIIKGKLSEVVYSVEKGSNTAFCACGDRESKELELNYEVNKNLTHTQGDLYLRLRGEYHSVSAKHGTVTKVTKYGNKVNAYVIAPRELEMIESLPDFECWKLVEEVLSVQH